MPVTTPFSPESYGRYYLVDKIAIGGMAEVFKACRFSDGGFQMLLVIKRILHQFSENDEFIQMFIDEARISVELQHPNIVTIYDFGKLHDNYFLAMECVEGKDLKSILRTLAKRRKLLPPEFAVYIAHEMCKGLDYAHKKADIDENPLGIVHRDISPSNILISYNGDIKIADFGIAKAQISAYNTKDGVLKGKFEYMSPEQASGKNINHQSDVFSAGILLHEMLTGRRLFKTDSDIKTLEKIKAVDINPPSARNPRVPKRLDALVMKALTQKTEDRYRDAKEMQTALAQYLYPATPSLTADQLAVFMQELFREEISEERSRLQEGTRIATALNEQVAELDVVEDWSGEPGTSTTIQQQPPSRAPIAIAIIAVIALLGVVAWALTRAPETERVEVITESQFGALQVRIRPEGTTAAFLLNGETVGKGETILLEELPPGLQQTLRIEAEGFFPYEEVITVEAGERLRLPVSLVSSAQPEELEVVPEVIVETPDPPPDTTTDDTPSPPAISFRSSPRGASVYVNGQLVGKTPMTWRSGNAGTSVQVEYQLDGYSAVSFSTTVPGENRQDRVSKTLKAEAAAPGKVRVQVKGWADVYVDGRASGQTPLTLELTPGSHTIRVQNPETGYEAQKTVDVVSGQLTKVTL
ncbi:MAG: serine/threonine protein kinase [Myxococcota bacterium]|jgi:serine/threonine protein kinase